MKLKKAAYILKEMLDRAGDSYQSPEVESGWSSCTYQNPDFIKAWQMFKEYARQQTSCELDLLEYSCGMAEACGPHIFHAHFGRRFRVGSKGGYPQVAAVECQFDYGWHPELNGWAANVSESARESERFFELVESLKEFQSLKKGYAPKCLTIRMCHPVRGVLADA